MSTFGFMPLSISTTCHDAARLTRGEASGFQPHLSNNRGKFENIFQFSEKLSDTQNSLTIYRIAMYFCLTTWMIAYNHGREELLAERGNNVKQEWGQILICDLSFPTWIESSSIHYSRCYPIVLDCILHNGFGVSR